MIILLGLIGCLNCGVKVFGTWLHPVEVYPILMQIGHNQDSGSILSLLVDNNIGQSVTLITV